MVKYFIAPFLELTYANDQKVLKQLAQCGRGAGQVKGNISKKFNSKLF